MATRRVQWQKPSKKLDGQTPLEWLAEEYPKEPRNSVLARRLSGILGFSVSHGALARKASFFGLKKDKEARKALNKYRGDLQRLPIAPAVGKFDDWPTFDHDPVVVTSDWHLPYYNSLLADRMFTLCQRWQPPVKHHVVAGDFVDFDTLSDFYHPERDSDVGRTTEDDLNDAEQILLTMADWFDEILLLRGNHENRLYTKKLQQEIGYERAMRVVAYVPDKVKFSKWPWCIINNEWRVTHPKSYRAMPLSLARHLAAKHCTNIIVGHGHNMAIGQDLSGQYTAIDSGGMVDPIRMGYYMLHDTYHPKWIPGFVIISQGKPHLFNNSWTDWKHYQDWLDIKQWR